MNKKAKIYYFSLTDEMRKEEKLEWFQNAKIQNIPFELITPDKKHHWLNITDNDFEELIPLINKKEKNTIFEFYSNGVNTARDEWVYDFDKKNLENKVKFFIEKYNDLLNKKDYSWQEVFKWSRDLKNKFNKGLKMKFQAHLIKQSGYRPFINRYFYAEKILNDVLTQNHYDMFGNDLSKPNKVISRMGLNTDKPYSVLSCNGLADYSYLSPASNGCRFYPLYRYNSEGQKIDNITDWALDLFRNHYVNPSVDTHRSAYLRTDLQKTDIFHYVYGVLHNPAYRKKYEQNLKRDFPRIPLYQDFWFWAEKGKALMDLHLNYEEIEPFKLRKIETELKKGKLNTPKLKADKEQGIIYLDQVTSLEGVPSVAFEYKLGNRSALEWVLDQYKEKKPRDKTIAEKFNTYRFADYKEQVIDLLRKVCTVSVKTMEIIREMEGENID